jgi:hypothetical protein
MASICCAMTRSQTAAPRNDEARREVRRASHSFHDLNSVCSLDLIADLDFCRCSSYERD